jgi:hypothetical protein
LISNLIYAEEFGQEFSHILEIYDFPTSFKNENILNALKVAMLV